MIQRLIYITIIFFIGSGLFAQNEWKLQKDDNGIKVYTRPLKGSEYNSLLAVMVIEAPMSQLYKILKHQYDYIHIFPDAVELAMLKRINDTTHLQYVLTDAPWPVSDRDGVFQQSYTKYKTNGFEVRAWAVPDYLPEKEGVVRVRKSQSHWTVKNIGNGKCEVKYEVNTDPGGNIPHWLADFAAVDLPYRIFMNLKKEIEK